ncbi:MAG: transglutaminase domain-containing protein [Chloroflexota bacterium]|nr:transglutaminase domain-containing protein [Chloroflexota bacterium]
MRRLARTLSIPTIYLLWTLLVLYPNPVLLARSVDRSLNPQPDPEAVREWARQLPDDPAYIERQVLDQYVPYAVPWQTLGVPWYFPTAREVVAMGRGDCQGRMLVLASLLKAKGIPYHLEASFDHIWVSYPHKIPNALERTSLSIMKNSGNGVQMQMPAEWDWRDSVRIEREYFLDPFPPGRLALLCAGWGAVLFRRRLVKLLIRLRLWRSMPAVPSSESGVV